MRSAGFTVLASGAMARVQVGLLAVAVSLVAGSAAAEGDITGDVALGLGATQVSTFYGGFNSAGGGIIWVLQ